MSNLSLKPNPTLGDLQRYIAAMVAERGFDNTIAQQFMFLLEEAGELAKASRKSAGMRMADDAARQDVAGEAADVFIILLDICNSLGIDLEQAFREKEEQNKQRVWR